MNKAVTSSNTPSSFSWQWADIILLAVAVIWGASYSLAKGALNYTPVLVFMTIRFGVTALLLLPFTIKELHHAGAQTWLQGGLLGGILFSIFLAETYGVAYTSASNAAFIISLCVVFTPIIDAIWKKQRPSPAILGAAALCIVGTGILTNGESFSINLGDALILLAALLRALMVTSTKRVTDIIELSTIALTQLQMMVVFIASLFCTMFLTVDSVSLPQTIDFWWRLLVIVLFCTLFAFFAQNYAVKKTNPTRASFLMGTEPLFGAMFAIYLLSEPFSVQLIIGGLFITTGTYIGMKLSKA